MAGGAARGELTARALLTPRSVETSVVVTYPAGRGDIGIRGSSAPWSWEHTTPPTRVEGDQYVFTIDLAEHETCELKLVRGEDDWALGRNFTLHAGDVLELTPAFDRKTCELLPPQTFTHGETTLSYQVLLPPTYGEQVQKRYPVIYAQDGQSLWTTSQDPFGVWHLDETIDHLLELAVVQEVIIVAIETSADRLAKLSPVPDPDHGGGQADAHLAAIIDGLKPHLDRELRTRPDREHTAVMGSSMGGLFSFYAAWTRPDVFGKAICLSSSFWWAGRHMIRAIAQAPSPRPVLYLDSGAALSEQEPRASAHDGFFHTRAMHRALGRVGYTSAELHRLTFPGQAHNASSWAARVALRCSCCFPPPRCSGESLVL